VAGFETWPEPRHFGQLIESGFIGGLKLYLVSNGAQEKSESFGFYLRKKEFCECEKGEVARCRSNGAKRDANYHGAHVVAEVGESRAGGFHWLCYFCG